jgi:protein required for attachment to host cells
MKPKRTWVLVADAGRARILEGDGSGHLVQVEGLSFETELPPTHELVADRQPRSIESVGGARHAISKGEDPHRKEKRKFVETIAHVLEERLDRNSFDRLVVVAPPQALGDLRGALAERVRARVVTEVAKDLTKTPTIEIPGHLGLSFTL